MFFSFCSHHSHSGEDCLGNFQIESFYGRREICNSEEAIISPTILTVSGSVVNDCRPCKEGTKEGNSRHNRLNSIIFVHCNSPQFSLTYCPAGLHRGAAGTSGQWREASITCGLPGLAASEASLNGYL